MKKSLFITALLSIVAITDATAQEMIVHLKDGKQVSYNIADVDSVELKAPSSAEENPYGASLSGTPGTAVDLGLSVRWADHNLGAYDATDSGGAFTFDDAATKTTLWADDWRLPTDAEWQELYEKCSWSWTVRNGIGGRLITASNGNSIFIPAAGISFDNSIAIRGCVGLYWTSDAAETTTLPSSTKAVGAYFDSANIYRMNYPMSNTLSVRLVKK